MIPRLKPYFTGKELTAIFLSGRHAVEDFEKKFAARFRTKHAVAFLYGRGGIYSLLKCMGIENSEVIMPAYTCVVVSNAVVCSGNKPRFVDITLSNYNMDLDLAEKAINEKTKAVIGVSLFGYPYDAQRLQDIISRSGRKILYIQDCAHSFGAEYNGKPLYTIGDAALFAFSLTKELSSIYGSIVTTNNEDIYLKLKKYRDDNFAEPSFGQNLKMLSLFLTAYVAFFEPFYGITNFLERRTRILDPIAKYYDENNISMPADFFRKISPINAAIAAIQLDKYEEIKKKRIAAARFYNEALKGLDGIKAPVLADGATYLYCVSMMEGRDSFREYMRKKGVQVGEYIPYSIPYMKAYEKYREGDYPNALLCSRSVVNLPCHPTLSENDLKKITGHIFDAVKKSAYRQTGLPAGRQGG